MNSVSVVGTAEMKPTVSTTVITGVQQQDDKNMDAMRFSSTQLEEMGKCVCCPYGYHIDCDFVQYCESFSDFDSLCRIQRTKRKLCKSVEYMLQGGSNTEENIGLRPDVVHSSEASILMHMLEREDRASQVVLNDIDKNISTNYYQETTPEVVQLSRSSFSETSEDMHNSIKQSYEADLSGMSSSTSVEGEYQLRSSLSPNTKTDVWLQYSGPVDTNHSSNYSTYTTAQVFDTTDNKVEVENHTEERDTITIKKSAFMSMKEALTSSLKRVKELEEQVKAIPVLQMRVSVLKEEKRLLQLQAKANEARSKVIQEKTEHYNILHSAPKVTKGTQTMSQALPSFGSSEFREWRRELQGGDNLSSSQKSSTMKRSIGVGDSFDSSGLKIHEKELRTVIISGQSPVGKRNVGIECRIPTRDVGVMYACDDNKPTTRTVGINVDSGSLQTTVSFKKEELSSALHKVLHHSVKSVGIMCQIKPEIVSVGTSYDRLAVRSIACGNDQVDSAFMAKRSIGVATSLEMKHKNTSTDKGWTFDASTNTDVQSKRSRSTTTEQLRMCVSACNTEPMNVRNQKCQTSIEYQAPEEKKPKVSVRSVGSNTGLSKLTDDSFDFDMDFKEVNEKSFDTQRQVKTTIMQDSGMDEGDFETSEQTGDEYTVTTYRTEIPVNSRRVTKKYTTRNYMGLSPDSGSRFGYGGSDGQSSFTSSSTSSHSSRIPSDSDSNRTVVEEYSSSSNTSGSQPSESSKDGLTRTTEYTIKRNFTSGNDIKVDYAKKDYKPSYIVEGVNPNPFDYGLESVSRSFKKRTSALADPDEPVQSSHTSQSTVQTTETHVRDLTEPDLENVEGYVRYLKGQENEENEDSTAESTEQRTVITYETVSSSSSDRPSEITSSSSTVRSYGSGNLVSSDMPSEISQQSSSSSMRSFGSGSLLSSDSPSGITQQTTRVVSYSSGGSGMENNGQSSLKSILKNKRTLSDSKKAITFDETVDKKIMSDDDDIEDSEDEDDDDDSSFDEATYNGCSGKLSYRFDSSDISDLSGTESLNLQGIEEAESDQYTQNIREMFDLPDNLRQSCETMAQYLEGEIHMKTRDLEACIASIKQDWFLLIKSDVADAYQIEDYMSCFNEISRSLLKYVVNLADDSGNTALHYAVSNGNYDAVSLLLDSEACEVDKPNQAGYTAIMLAALTAEDTLHQRTVVKQLLAKGNINAKAMQAGQTALMLAVSHGRINMVRLLLAAGADVNERDYDGSTALMCACEHGQTDIAKILLGRPECNVNLKDNDGSTALEIAMEAGNRDIGVLLYANLNFARSPTQVKK